MDTSPMIDMVQYLQFNYSPPPTRHFHGRAKSIGMNSFKCRS